MTAAGGTAGGGVPPRKHRHRILGVFSKKHHQAAEESFGDLMGTTPNDT